MVRVPVTVPVTVGVNVTLIVQLELLASVVLQVEAETANGFVALKVMPVKFVSRLFLSVTFLGWLVVPTFCFGNVRLSGVTTVCAMPVPDIGTVCGLPGALSKTFSVADSAPNAVGVKVTLTLQPIPAVRVGPQAFDVIAKSLFPVTLMPFKSRME